MTQRIIRGRFSLSPFCTLILLAKMENINMHGHIHGSQLIVVLITMLEM